MEAILPFKIKNEQKFYESAIKVGYNEMEAYKFLYVMQQSDLDIFPKMHDERINILIYGWELCEDYKQKLNPNEWELPEEMETILKLLVPWSMDIWFSKEWDKCKYLLKSALIHCLNRARDLLMRMPDMMQINWDFLLLYNLKPWNVIYLKNLTVTKEKTLENGAQSIETEELPATDEDLSYVKLEQLPIIVLRLVKIFDQSSIDMVKTLCMRVIAAWNKMYQTELETSGSRRPYIPPEDKRCLMLICHIYLMAVYESDDVKGYIIDNMINNIRFYYQGFQNSAPLHAMDNLEYTPARYIALTNIHLRVQKRDFFDFFIWNKYDTSLVNLFGVVSQAYKSYLLGNLLMELNNMNEDDFAANIPLYKRLMNSYVNEREKSELFLLNELDKIEAQRYAHNIIQTVQNVTDFKSKICKGNRMGNIGNYENSDDTVAPLADIKTENKNSGVKVDEIKEDVIGEDVEDEQERVRIKESELRLDPIFQNLPNNESILYYVYDVLARKDYKGWHFAKVVLLVKIIDREQNMIETWRYHPGLTTDFMLNLEVKLSHHYIDLAKIFKDHPFIEQEFWLTAFYLNPIAEVYECVKRLGMRNNRKRTDEHTKLVMSIDNIEAKYGLLSSTIDVKELATMSNTDDPVTDYDPLFAALHSLRVPDSLVKDMLTAIFLPRNRSFAWAVDWVVLRNRCKMIMTSSKEKKRFVDLNMAEANERLKYLIIDYEKYKNRPQLDYGSIEEGYENLMTSGEFDKVSDEEEEEEEEEDFEDDEDVYESKRRGRGSLTATARKKEAEKVEDDNSQEDDPFLMGKRRTRARTAATLASFLFQTLPRTSRRKRNLKPTDEENKTDEEKISADTDDKSSDSKSPIPTSESPVPPPLTASSGQKDSQVSNVPTKYIKECLKERPTYFNTTQGFQNLIDIWNVEKADLQTIDENCVSLMESASALQIAVKLKSLYKEINPLGCDEKEYIDDSEMIIHNADFVIKKECAFNAAKHKVISDVKEKMTNVEGATMLMQVGISQQNVDEVDEEIAAFMEIDDDAESVETDRIISQTTSIEETAVFEEMADNKENVDVDRIISQTINTKEYALFEKLDDVENERNITQTTNTEKVAASEKVDDKEENVAIDKIGDPYVVHNVEISEESELQISEISNVVDNVEISKESELKLTEDIMASAVSEETPVAKVTEHETSETENKKQLQTSKDNSSESRNLDVSTVAVKGSEEVRKSKLEIETENNNSTAESEAVNEQNGNKETEVKKSVEEQKETTTHQETESEQNKSSEDKDAALEEENKRQKENNANECRAAEKLLQDKITEHKETDSKNKNDKTTMQQTADDTSKNDDLIAEKTSDINKESNNTEVNRNEPTVSVEIISENCFDEIQLVDFLSTTEKELENTKITDESLLHETNKSYTELLSNLENENKKVQISEYKTEIMEDLATKAKNQKSEETETCPRSLESQELTDTNPETLRKEDNLESIDPAVLDDEDSSPRSQNIILHYSSSEELIETDAKTNQMKLETTEYKGAPDTTSVQEQHAIIDDKKDSYSPVVSFDDTTADSTRTKEEQDSTSTDSETRNLKKSCLTKNVQILVQKLRPEDLKSLRQPKVKIQRLSFEKYTTEFRAKRRRVEERVYLEFEDSSNSNSYGTNTSSSEAYHPTRVKRKVPIKRHLVRQVRTSESDNDSINSDDCKLSTIKAKSRKRRLSTPSTSQSSTSKRVTGPKSARKTGPKSARRTAGPKTSKQNLVVIPRSASGLKLRISNAEQNRQEAAAMSKRSKTIVFDEVIQLSSSSSDAYLLTTIEEEVIEIEENPLFEEEIII